MRRLPIRFTVSDEKVANLNLDSIQRTISQMRRLPIGFTFWSDRELSLLHRLKRLMRSWRWRWLIAKISHVERRSLGELWGSLVQDFFQKRPWVAQFSIYLLWKLVRNYQMFLLSRIASVSEMGKNLAGAAVIQPDASDGSAPEDPYA